MFAAGPKSVREFERDREREEGKDDARVLHYARNDSPANTLRRRIRILRKELEHDIRIEFKKDTRVCVH